MLWIPVLEPAAEMSVMREFVLVMGKGTTAWSQCDRQHLGQS